MPDTCVRPGGRERAGPLRGVQNLPGIGQQNETAADEHNAQDMKRAEMRVGTPAEENFQEMAGVVREPVNAGVATLQPAREQVDGQWKTVHFSEERHQKRRERAEGSPVA